MKSRVETEALLRRMQARGVRLSLEGGSIRVNASKGVLDDCLRAELTANKPELIALLRETTPLTSASASRDGRPLLSAAQKRLWFLDQVDPGNAAYNMAGALRIRGPLDRAGLEGAFEELIARHDAFRTRIGERDGGPWIEVTEAARAHVEFVDLSGEPPGQSGKTALRLANQLASSGFELARGPLTKLLIIALADDHHVLVSSTHHAVFDGWSMNLMLSEVFRLYQARRDGTISPLVPLTCSPVDHAAWEHEQLVSGRFAGSLAYWQKALHHAPAVLELPTDRPRPLTPTFSGGRLTKFIDPSLLAQVRLRAQQHNATPFMALMACWQAVLHRYSGQDDIVVGTTLANRERPEFEGLIGCLINTVVVRGRLHDNPTFAEFLDQVRGQSLLAFEHGQVPFDLVVEQINPQRSISHAPVFQVLFTHMGFPISMPPVAELVLEPIVLDPTGSRFDLTCEMSVDPVGAHANLQRVSYDYSLDLFDAHSIARLHEHFEQMMVAFVADISQRIGDVPLTPSTQDRCLIEASSTVVDHDRSVCAHHLFEAAVAAGPEESALSVAGERYSYADLDRRANRLARLLQGKGVEHKHLVAFCLERNADIPVTMAAVLKAGAAYVPLDPTHPQDRLRYVVEDSCAACVVTSRRFAALFDESKAKLIILDDAQGELDVLSDEPLAIPVGPGDLAYVLYTSGSTGRPKGVEVEHRNLVAFLDAMAREPGFARTDVLLAVTTPAFDISGLEIWLPLVKGGHIVMASRSDVIDGARLAELIRANNVTVLQATPATWRLLMDSGWKGKADLKALCGGEAMTADLAARLLGRVGELWNMYGPTETTIWSTLARVRDATGPIPIGRPIANTRARVLDARGRQVPIGVVGELCIGGEGVARGYHDRPELTSAKFVVLDALGERSERLYRTGDLARFRSDGQLEFLGRRDQQVKLRGYRIELGEIEAVLATHRGVRQCVVLVREDTPGDQRLTAYMALEPGAAFDVEAAKFALRERLPDYMIPRAFVVSDALPLTPNGKIDRAALPLPVAAALPAGAERATDLMNPVQRRVAVIWRELLAVQEIGLNDNFFDLGGHSLMLIKLHARLQSEFSIELPLVELFQRTTVAAQAGRMGAPVRTRDALDRAQSRAARLDRV